TRRTRPWPPLLGAPAGAGARDLLGLGDEIALVGGHLVLHDEDVERQRLVAVGLDVHLVRTRRQLQLLERAVEVVHLPGEVPADVDLGVARLDLEAQPARGFRTLDAARRRVAARTAVVAVAIAVSGPGP